MESGRVGWQTSTQATTSTPTSSLDHTPPLPASPTPRTPGTPPRPSSTGRSMKPHGTACRPTRKMQPRPHPIRKIRARMRPARSRPSPPDNPAPKKRLRPETQPKKNACGNGKNKAPGPGLVKYRHKGRVDPSPVPLFVWERGEGLSPPLNNRPHAKAGMCYTPRLWSPRPPTPRTQLKKICVCLLLCTSARTPKSSDPNPSESLGCKIHISHYSTGSTISCSINAYARQKVLTSLFGPHQPCIHL